MDESEEIEQPQDQTIDSQIQSVMTYGPSLAFTKCFKNVFGKYKNKCNYMVCSLFV